MHEVVANLDDTVLTLKQGFADVCDKQVGQIKLLDGDVVLEDEWILAEHNLHDGHEVSILIAPAVPDFAKELGLDGEHPMLLQQYYERHQLERPAWLDSVDEIWDMLRQSREATWDSKTHLRSWDHMLILFLDDECVGVVRARPQEEITVRVKGSVHNKQADSCIHQVIVAMDCTIVSELYSGVPGRGKTLNRTVQLVAPADAGVYMIWSTYDLQFTMQNAVARFRHNFTEVQKVVDQYPGGFVAWLVVEGAAAFRSQILDVEAAREAVL